MMKTNSPGMQAASSPGLSSHLPSPLRFSRWVKNAAKKRPQEDTIELSMIDEIKEQRRRELAKKTRACEEAVMNLNAERLGVHTELDPCNPRYFYEVACKHDQAFLSRREWELLHAKGVDFLVEVELGNAPPLKYIVRNLTADNPMPELVNPDPGQESMPFGSPPQPSPRASDGRRGPTSPSVSRIASRIRRSRRSMKGTPPDPRSSAALCAIGSAPTVRQTQRSTPRRRATPCLRRSRALAGEAFRLPAPTTQIGSHTLHR